MKAVRRLFARVRGAFAINAADADLDREMRAHLEIATDDFMRRGMTREEAGRAALVEARGLDQAREAYRDQRGIPALQVIDRNFRFAVRGLRRNPGYSAAIIASLALGIGLNTAVFTVVDNVIRRPLPYVDAMNIVTVGMLMQRPGGPPAAISWAPYNVIGYWKDSRSLGPIATFHSRSAVVQGAGAPEHVNGGTGSANLLRVLGVEPQRGRWFADGESGSNVVVLSEALWRRQFSADTAAVGRVFKIDGRPHTVIGVLRRGTGLPLAAQYWVPADAYGSQAIARLPAGISLATVAAELETLAPSVANLRKAGYTVSVVAMPLHEQLFGSARPTLRLLLAAAVVLLLIACANITNLTLARTLDRRRELSMRMALGASARSLSAMVIMENALLALTGATAGILLAFIGKDLLTAFAPPSIVLSRELAIQGPALGFAIILAVGCCLAVSIFPVLNVARHDAAAGLGLGGARSGRGRAMRDTRRVLVVAQLALALVLMTGSGLLLRSIARLTQADHLGFSPAGLILVDVRPFTVDFGDRVGRRALRSALLERLRRIPGVEDIAVGPPPLVGGTGEGYREGFNVIFNAQAPGSPIGEMQMVWAKFVDDRYIDTYQMRLRSGRGFRPSDDSMSAQVAIVNASAARLFFGSLDPIGRELPPTGLTRGKPSNTRVVGLIDDALQADAAIDAMPEVFLPSMQQPLSPNVTATIRTALPAPAMIQAIHRAIREVDPELGASRLEAMDDVVAASVSRHRFVLRLLGVFATLGLVLSVIGLYAVVSYLVAQRSVEMSVRIALGAQRRHIAGLVLREGALMATLGVALGVPIAMASSRFLGNLLYEVKPTDAMSVAGGTALLAVVALLASYVPARRAANLDPARTLRTD